ncbi:acyltransferase [Polaromonas sp. JS666]|uniref:acyltransferase family protein n=1 Tax=Polaromonas sp. (strain JS666 / ATCC BAA-500) TaxID=296591 RepID=UPI00088E87CB|nr:acyltransferase [Polaromonas sp. JS666]SDM59369.1 Peptidoglycan/LPS O-acetylase OafA/YrhL, contains acyltransferase and SGNH-hydrolase domains [Polaromonas sp. JS666]
MTAPQRLQGLDALKGLACVLIVWHHLAFYGPMSDVVYGYAPGLMDWLYDYGRMAVQLFLVVGGFLAAASLAPKGTAVFDAAGPLILRRYGRLVKPYLVALAASVLVAALLRPWFDHPSVPAAPTLLQLLAHGLLLQDLLGQESLSAGVWYVAMDLQLYAVAVLVFAASRRLRTSTAVSAGAMAVLLIALLSLLVFNRQPSFDITALYFFGAYALGMLAFWASREAGARRGFWLSAIAVLGTLALALDFRGRLVVAVVTALVLVWLSGAPQDAWPLRWLRQRRLQQLGRISYSVFLIHFPVCLLVNAVVSHFWPTQLAANALGMLLAFVLSLLAGQALYRWVESAPLRLAPRKLSA